MRLTGSELGELDIRRDEQPHGEVELVAFRVIHTSIGLSLQGVGGWVMSIYAFFQAGFHWGYQLVRALRVMSMQSIHALLVQCCLLYTHTKL
jgi:hypothetical protein